MKRKARLILVVLCCGLLPSCLLLDTECIEAPPTQGRFQTSQQHDKEMQEWWQKTIDEMSLNFLAVYAEASASHQRQGTATVYATGYAYRTAGCNTKYEHRLPCPPPDYALPWISARLQGYNPSDSEMNPSNYSYWWFHAHECRGCTAEEAEAIWEHAEDKIGKGKARE